MNEVLAGATMKKQLPTVIVVIATLHFVGGGLGLIGDGLGVATLLAGGGGNVTKKVTAYFKSLGPAAPSAQAEEVDVEEIIRQQVPSYTTFMIGHLCVDTLLSLMMIAAGVGLLKLQPWARSLSLFYGLCSIVVRLIQVVYSYALLIGASIIAVEMQYQAMPEPQRGVAMSMLPMVKVMMYAIPLFNLIWTIYPVVVLALLTRPRVVEAFHNAGNAPAEIA